LHTSSIRFSTSSSSGVGVASAGSIESCVLSRCFPRPHTAAKQGRPQSSPTASEGNSGRRASLATTDYNMAGFGRSQTASAFIILAFAAASGRPPRALQILLQCPPRTRGVAAEVVELLTGFGNQCLPVFCLLTRTRNRGITPPPSLLPRHMISGTNRVIAPLSGRSPHSRFVFHPRSSKAPY